ncbi:hypothetical protein L6R53_17835 [Myxococcota bacterium]|nr:hypothetical protein [Myxococcota bacterium]
MAGKPKKHPTVTKRALKRADGTYWTLRWTQDGRRTERPAEKDGLVGYLSEDQAEEARADQEAMLRLGLQPQEQGRSRPWDVGDVLVLYLEHVTRQRGGSPYAKNQEKHVLALCEYFGSMVTPRADRLRTSDLESLALAMARQPGNRPGRTLSRATIASRLAVLPRAYGVARRAGTIDCDCPDLPRLTKVLPDNTRPPRDITEGEVRALVAAAERRWGPDFADFLEFSAWQPRRPLAILGLTMADCERLITPGLARKERKVYFSADKGGVGRGWGPVTEPALRAAVRQVERRRAQGALRTDSLWVNAEGRPLRHLSAWERLKKIATVQASGVEDVTLYDLRKHGVGQLFRHTYNLRAMLPHTGHRTVATLLRYLSTVGFDANDLAGQVDWGTPALQLVHSSEDAP